jgi:hypothetical protein
MAVTGAHILVMHALWLFFFPAVRAAAFVVALFVLVEPSQAFRRIGEVYLPKAATTSTIVIRFRRRALHLEKQRLSSSSHVVPSSLAVLVVLVVLARYSSSAWNDPR